MDRILIEKITEIVLSKIQNQAAYLPLSDEEIKDWERIDFTVSSATAACEANQSTRPLSENELRHWGELSQSFQAIPSPKGRIPDEGGQVYFRQYIK